MTAAAAVDLSLLHAYRVRALFFTVCFIFINSLNTTPFCIVVKKHVTLNLLS